MDVSLVLALKNFNIAGENDTYAKVQKQEWGRRKSTHKQKAKKVDEHNDDLNKKK